VGDNEGVEGSKGDVEEGRWRGGGRWRLGRRFGRRFKGVESEIAQ
jgi:hypothetical protein